MEGRRGKVVNRGTETLGPAIKKEPRRGRSRAATESHQESPLEGRAGITIIFELGSGRIAMGGWGRGFGAKSSRKKKYC